MLIGEAPEILAGRRIADAKVGRDIGSVVWTRVSATQWPSWPDAGPLNGPDYCPNQLTYA